MIEKILPIMVCRFSNDHFALRNAVFCTLNNFQAIIKFEYQAFNEYNADLLIIAWILKNEIKQNVLSDVNIEI